MPPAATTYAEVIAKNIRAARGRADINQQLLADRMRNLGFTAWLHQTVGNVERGKRRVTAEEALGLAIALETTMQHLLSPLLQDGPAVLPSGLSLSAGQIRALVFGHGPNDNDPYSVMRDVRDGRGIRWVGGALEAGGDQA
jgi:transcriptional regulator with XRE-family HTH domain